MAYQSRMRNYKTPREKNRATWRNVRLVLLFAVIALAIWAFKERQDLWDWFRLKYLY